MPGQVPCSPAGLVYALMLVSAAGAIHRVIHPAIHLTYQKSRSDPPQVWRSLQITRGDPIANAFLIYAKSSTSAIG